MASHRHRAVLVLPDIGVPEEKVQGLTHEFQNNIVGTLRKAGARVGEDESVVIIIVVVIIVAEEARPER